MSTLRLIAGGISFEVDVPQPMIEAMGEIIDTPKWGYESPDEFVRECIRMNIMRFR